MEGGVPVDPVGSAEARRSALARDVAHHAPRAASRRQWAYLTLINFLSVLAIGVGGYAYTNYVNDQRIRDERRASAARAVQAEQTRLIVCQIALGQADAFRESTSPTGIQARDGWLALAREFHCE